MEPEVVVNATPRPLDVYDPEGREIRLHLPTSQLIIDATTRWVTLPERSVAGVRVPSYGWAYELTAVDHDGNPAAVPEQHDDTLYVVGEDAAIASAWRPDFVTCGPPVLDGDRVIGCKGLGLPGLAVAALPEPRRFDELAELALHMEWPEHHPRPLSKPSEMAVMTDERADDAFRDLEVTKIDAGESGHWCLAFEGESWIWLSREGFEDTVPWDLAPKVGDTVRLYGRGSGYKIHGVDLNGRRVWYRTRAERHILDRVMRLEKELRSRIELDRDRAALEERFAEFSAHPAQRRDADRIAWFLRREHGWAEGQIVNRDEATEAVQTFRDLPYREREARVPMHWCDADIFHEACRLAVDLLEGERE